MIFRRTPFTAALFALFLCFVCAPSLLFAEELGASKAPIQIESREISREGNLSIAKGDVVIGVGDTTIYCDYAQCDIVTRDVMVSGGVRIFRGEKVFSGDRAIYNLDSKRITGAEFRTAAGPFLAQAHALVSLSSDAFEASRGMFTTDNTSDPGFHLRARKVRIFHNDHTEYENVTVYVGRTPVLWLPYLYQPGSSDQSFSIAPGSNSIWGAFFLTRFAIPVNTTTYGGLRLDYMGKRGLGAGLDMTQLGQSDGSWGRFRSYYVADKAPGTKDLGSANDQIDSARFRVSIQDRTFLSETVYTSVNFNKLSDINFFRDFSPSEMQRDPNPDSLFALTKWSENYTLTAEVRKQFNKDFESAETVPALSLDAKRQPFLDTGIFYDGETSAGKLRRNFLKKGTLFEFANYDTVRLDTFHQWSYPKVLGGWLSVIPRVGVRGTHYGSSVLDSKLELGDPLYGSGGAVDRGALNAGLETSFKISRVFETVENRAWGLDGLRHIVQPFANLSWVSTSRSPATILPMDTLSGSTKLPAIDFPQFNTIDSLTNWDILRLGVRNRLQTRRDQDTLNWLELETFMDVRVQQPDYASVKSADTGGYSNVFNRLRWAPLPWLGVILDSQLPVLDQGFTEFNSATNVQVTRDLSLIVGNRFVNGNAYFSNSNLVNGGARYRVNDNWSVSFEENYEFQTRQMEYQRYSLDRDLRSWLASFSLVVRERAPKNDVAVLLTLILKDVPKFRLPLHVDPEAMAGASSSNKNR
jgi:LPS-assembly protein